MTVTTVTTTTTITDNLPPAFIDLVAKHCFEVNKAYRIAIGDISGDYDKSITWETEDALTKKSIRAGVQMHLNADVPASASHEAWLALKVEEGGWTYGPEKSYMAKTHPCFLPYDQLPKEQQAKDHIFRAVVHLHRDIAVAYAIAFAGHAHARGSTFAAGI